MNPQHRVRARMGRGPEGVETRVATILEGLKKKQERGERKEPFEREEILLVIRRP